MSSGPEEVEELIKDGEWALLHGRLEEAESAYADAERIATDPLDRARSLEGLANVFIKQGHFDKAKELLSVALDLFGESVPASTWGNLGFALDKMGAFDEALAAHRKCVAAHAAADGVQHPRTLRKLGDLAYSLVGLDKLDDAESVLQEMVDGFESQRGREPLWHAKALSSFGYFFLRSRHDPQRALENFDLAEALRDACSLRSPKGQVIRDGFPEDFEAILVGNRAAALTALGRVEEAAQSYARYELLNERGRAKERRLREG